MLTNSRDIIRRLEKDGWILIRTKGSHSQFKLPGTGAVLTVPHPKKDLPLGTVRAIYKTANWPKD